jgi:hypothetical protein
MKTRFYIRPELIPDGEGFYGVRAVAEITFVQHDGTHIVGTKVASPGLWEIDGDVDDEYLEAVALEEMDTLADMLIALGVPNVDKLMPSEISFEEAAATAEP